MIYKQLGQSGIRLPLISMGLWHNFGDFDDMKSAKEIICRAFYMGITHFDLANVYGQPAGSAEINFGKILKKELSQHRDEMIIASKAGHSMGENIYLDGCSRKTLISSCNQSLKRVGVEYFDIFYAHRYDPLTPLEETMSALDYIVRSGKALYIGLSKFPKDKAQEAYAILKRLGTPCVADQQRYSLLNRGVENGILTQNSEAGVGTIAFSPLSQGLLTNRYIDSIPEDSRAAKESGYLKIEEVHKNINISKELNKLAEQRGQTLAQMSISWLINNQNISSVLTGVSSVEQLIDTIQSINNTSFTTEELSLIDSILATRHL